MEFRIKTAKSSEVAQHLLACDKAFIPALSERVNIEEYSVKITDKAHTFEAWNENELIGLVAAYINFDSLTAFITNVSVLNNYSRAGIGKQLLLQCIAFLRDNNIQSLSLEVGMENLPALELYKKFNFEERGSGHNTKILELKI